MSISLEQLRTSLTEHADGSDVQVTDRLLGVRRRVAARRRRRAALVAGSLAVVVVAVVGVGLQATRPQQTTPPAANPNPVVNGLPLYADGGRQIGSAQTAPVAGTTQLFTATPTSYDLSITVSCTSAGEGTAYTVLVNGHDSLGSSCGDDSISSTGSDFVDQAQSWTPSGVHTGQPVQIGLRITHRDPSARADATISVAFYQGVPRSGYPFPKAPAHVAPPQVVADPLDQPVLLTVGSADPSRPLANGSAEITRPYAANLAVSGTFSAPGVVRVLVDGKLVEGHATWDYTPDSWVTVLDPTTLRDAGVVAQVGQRITFTIEFSEFNRPGWKAEFGYYSTS